MSTALAPAPLALPPAGVAMLVFTGTKPDRVSVFQSEREIPGMRYFYSVTDGGHDTTTVVVQAQGYDTDAEAHTAIARAAQACIDAGLRVDFAPPKYGIARLVRRR